MLSLYEILKASKTGLATDMWTALAGMNWGGADSGHEVKELTGIPPLRFTADGTPLLDYLISGNTVQNGTPTPDNPIMPNGTGERTGNLFDLNSWYVQITPIRCDVVKAGDTITITATGQDSYTGNGGFHVEAKANTTYTFKINSNNNKTGGIYLFENGIVDSEHWHVLNNNSTNKSTTFTTRSDTTYMTIRLGVYNPDDSITFSEIMLNEGSTALPYEPYGIKIPISSANTTTNIYLGKVQTTRKIKKQVLTGEESWTLNNNQLMYVSKNTEAISYESVLCTHYISAKSFMEVYRTTNSTAVTNQGIYINSGSTDIADFKSYLAAQYAAGTPVTVWYVLATPETAVVNEPLMKIGDYADTVSYEQAQVSIPTLHGNTVIDVLTDVKPSEVYIKYQE